MSETKLLRAIEEDDRRAVKTLLRNNPALAASRLAHAELHTGAIRHWLYAGDTPLHLAAAGYRIEVVRLLLDAGGDPNASHNHRQSGPLHYAADTCLNSPAFDERRQVETITRLLAAGARINAPDKNGATPLHRATRTRGAAAVQCLLRAGADPSLRNKPGSTAFHLAVQNTGRGGSGSDAAKAAQRQIIQTFLAFGLRPTLKDARGQPVLATAKSDWIRQLLGG